MRRITFIITLIFITLIGYAQETVGKINLIPNPSFEDENLCVKYNELCCPEAWRSTTLKGYYYLNDLNSKSGKNPAADGHRMVSLCMHSSKRVFDRGFIQVPLLCPLQADQQYELSFITKHLIIC